MAPETALSTNAANRLTRAPYARAAGRGRELVRAVGCPSGLVCFASFLGRYHSAAAIGAGALARICGGCSPVASRAVGVTRTNVEVGGISGTASRRNRPGRRPWLKRRRCPSYLLPWQPRNRGSCVHSMGWKPKRKQPGTSPGDASNSYLTQARPACQCRLCVGYHFGYWDASLELPGRPGDTISAAGFPTGRARPTRGRSWTTSRPGERGRVFSSRTFSFQRESGAARQRGFDRRTSMVQAQRFGLVSGRNWPHNAGDVPAARHREPTVSDIGGYDSQRGTTWHLPIGSVRNGGTRTRRFASQR
jgi:hypothetical protein